MGRNQGAGFGGWDDGGTVGVKEPRQGPGATSQMDTEWEGALASSGGQARQATPREADHQGHGHRDKGPPRWEREDPPNG